MNVDTGELIILENDIVPEGFVEILKSQMTQKQLEKMQVDKHDSGSELGKIFTGNRKERRAAAALARRRK